MKYLSILMMGLVFGSITRAQADSTALKEWRDLKYSMFIHFGVYSHLGGVWDGKQINRGLSEQIQAHAGIYSDTYEDVAKQFNPVNWNADSIVSLAKQGGMGSIVITSKHHDGFAMFNSAHTEFDIIDGTAFKRDILKELSEACKKAGLKFGLYFSLIDWHFPQAAPISSHNSDPITPEHHQYNLKQITELLTNYGKVSELWFDMGSMSFEQSREMRELVHRLQPDCMIGSRIGNDMGDFTVMGDNQEPDYIIGVPWQSPASFFDETWGYRSWQKRTGKKEKMKEKLTSLIRVASRGGNFLLNIGPKGDGSVVDYEKDILLQIGEWLKKNSEAIYGTDVDPFYVPFEWGSITSRPDKLYLHVMKDPGADRIYLPGLKGNIRKSYILDDGTTCTYTISSDGVAIKLPAGIKPEDEFRVIVIEFANGYTVPFPNMINLDGKGVELHSGNAFKFYSNSGIDYNTRFTSTIKESWTLLTDFSGTVVPELIYSEHEKGKEIVIGYGGKEQVVKLENDKAISLKNNMKSLSTGPFYINGPLYSGIGDTHASLNNIDVTKQWPGNSNSSWKIMSSWKNGEMYNLPAADMTAYYVLQQIESPVKQQVIAEITAGESLMFFLNGDQKYIYNDRNKSGSTVHIMLLDLEKGKNQVVIKLFNNFNKEIPFSINFPEKQILYSKKLPSVTVTKNKAIPVNWKLHHPPTPHQHLNLPNAGILIRKK